MIHPGKATKKVRIILLIIGPEKIFLIQMFDGALDSVRILNGERDQEQFNRKRGETGIIHRQRRVLQRDTLKICFNRSLKLKFESY